MGLVILVVGAVNIDNCYEVDKISSPGETIKAFQHYVCLGGKGANQAAACALAGSETHFISMANQSDRHFILEELEKKRSVNCHLMDFTVTDIATGHAIIQIDKKANNSIVIFGGCNDKITSTFTLAQVTNLMMQQKFHGSKGNTSVLILQNELDCSIETAQQVKTRNLVDLIVWNPSPCPTCLYDFKRLKFLFDIIVVNEIELFTLTSYNTDDINHDDINHDDINPDKSLLQGIKRLHEILKPQLIVVTKGSDGAYFSSLEGDPDIVHHVPLDKIPLDNVVVDTTGAGDCWLGYFISNLKLDSSCRKRLDCDENVISAMKIANTAASLSVTRKGAIASIPNKKEVQTWILSK